MLVDGWSCWGSGLREAWTRKLPGVWGSVPTCYIYSQWIAHLPFCSHIAILLILHFRFNVCDCYILWQLTWTWVFTFLGWTWKPRVLSSYMHNLVFLPLTWTWTNSTCCSGKHRTHLLQCLQCKCLWHPAFVLCWCWIIIDGCGGLVGHSTMWWHLPDLPSSSLQLTQRFIYSPHALSALLEI